jgi:hypothetical protein
MLGGRGHSHNIQIAGQVKRAIAAIGAPAFPVLPDRPLVNTIHIRYSSKAIKHSPATRFHLFGTLAAHATKYYLIPEITDFAVYPSNPNLPTPRKHNFSIPAEDR